MSRLVCAYVCVLCVSWSVRAGASVRVVTTLGPVQGTLVRDGLTGIAYYAYQGIPYAEAPVGNLRFKPPVRKRAWTTTFDATKPGRVCPQIELYHSRGEMDEDCLNFNIYAPAVRNNSSLPVKFNIHDGDFRVQSGNAVPLYGPQFIMQYDTVVVTMNYRLGALGFLSLCNEEVSGNAGIKDILLVLKIVHENIDKFGGDPRKITVRGTGAGAVIAESLMLTDRSVGLYQNVMLHGGSILSANYFQLDPWKNAMLLVRELGLHVVNHENMMEKLKNVNAFDIVQAQEAVSLKTSRGGLHNRTPFKPCIETKSNSAIITRPPLEMIREGAILDIPMLIGFNDQEGADVLLLLRREPHLIDRLNENLGLLIPEDIRYPPGSLERTNLTARIKDFYFGGRNISFINKQNLVNLKSDSQYTFPIDLFVTLFKLKNNSPVYYYIFAGDTELNDFKAFANITCPGAAHSDDNGYIFTTTFTGPRYRCLSTAARRIQNSVLHNGKYFMYYGAPAPNPDTASWPEAGRRRRHLLVDNDGAVPVARAPLPDRIGFWSSVYEEYFNSKWYTGA